MSPEEREYLAAVKQGNAEAVAELVDRHSPLARVADENDKTGLHWAAERDHVEVARVLLDTGADLEAVTSWGATPLDWAAVMGSTRVADLLLARGAGGFTLVIAAALGKLDDVRAVLESGADLLDHRRRGAPRSPSAEWPADSAHMQGDVLSDALYSAARNGHASVVADLHRAGARIDAKGFFGATGLHWAAINGHSKVVALLLARGATVAVRDPRFSATPAEWAEEGGHPEIAKALRVHGNRLGGR